MIAVQQHFVTFASPGTFFPETSTLEIDAWDIDTACKMAVDIVERHGARPYGFYFSTHGRTAKQLNAREIASSPFYFINCRAETREEVEAANRPDEEILRANMRNNDIKAIARAKSGWKTAIEIRDHDVVLDFELPPVAETRS